MGVEFTKVGSSFEAAYDGYSCVILREGSTQGPNFHLTRGLVEELLNLFPPSPKSRTMTSGMLPKGFSMFRAFLNGTEIGNSVLHGEWDGEAVLQQLLVDGCPFGVGDPRIVGWPSDHFKVVCQDGREIQFDIFCLSIG
jgi:hypothetical protein